MDEHLEKMFLCEKSGQLNQAQDPKTSEELEGIKRKIRMGETGLKLLVSGATAGDDELGRVNRGLYSELQRIAAEGPPNGIPIYRQRWYSRPQNCSTDTSCPGISRKLSAASVIWL